MTDVDVSNLSSGLLGALIGAVVGGATTYFGQRHLADREVKRRRAGVIKALMGEMVHNTGRVIGVVVYRELPSAYLTAVWDAGIFEIAHFTDRPQFARLLQVYGMVDLAYRASQQVVSSPNSGAKQALQWWYEMTRSAFNMLLAEDRFKDATAGWQPMDPFDQEVTRARHTSTLR